MQELYDFLKAAIPEDDCRQASAESVLEARVARGFLPSEVLDFGCGDGRSIDLFKRLLPKTRWTGIDIAASPEVASRRRTDGHFMTYDGYELPLPNASYALVFSKQVLEHVRKPELALREIARVLKKEGLFIGQTSQFEPYHSYSMWNFTIYGFKRIAEDAGLNLVEFRPGIDGFTLMQRSYQGRPASMSHYFTEESPVNREIEAKARQEKRHEKIINYRKLVYCGQFAFALAPQ
ncbi:class I SAM-dependent methyltransferase [Aquabacterium sp. A7-Y]|uniref:class I SAM-dependent methyltransferase n=1 Tax=Aquabacterium sp. A7-Y TaxID=1349605 RepID=UPI00223CE526|nr:class I SAM-dependent methyltransferase [Aquabacterium sp. A7-Y]MCW7538926.1 class I SAM-dependent methyltransferase [Aquabacterium sp. A7-Y]